MKCSKCFHVNPDEAKFCQECGNRLIVASEVVRASSLPDAERKRVTALFSDLSGYTYMTEKLDPEEVKEITSSIFNGIRDVVGKYEGSIERFSGDGVLALFSVPKVHEDDPIRAIRAAREIHGLVESMSPRYERKVGRALSMHSGVNTGLAVTADVTPEKGTHGITGDAINVAARFSELAEAGEILVGLDTHRATQNHFTFQPLKPTRMKGKSEPIPIYKVISEKTGDDGIRQNMQVSSVMVGRDQELAKLEFHVLKAVNGQGSVVNVFGEPGIGKSRLLAELRQRDVISRVSFLEGRSISIGKNLSFHPIIDLYKQWSKIQEDDTQAEASSKLETAIRRVCGDNVDEVFPFLATMMGMKLSGKNSQRLHGIEGEALEKLILKSVRELLIRSTELIPIVIVMEDLHWADTTSLEVLESVFRLAQTHRVVFINVFRPGYWQEDDRKIETLPEWLPEVDFAEIAIKPLDRQMGETLVNNMLQVKGLTHSVKQQIIDRAGGNPLFMEEIVRSLIDEGAIVRTNGAFEVTKKIDHVVIPPTINDVLMARIDRLGEQTRDLIKIASVIGRSFFDRILKEVANSIENIDERLAYLKDAQFIRDRMRMEELEYLFKHALAQETAYESILLRKRKELHLKVAGSIEKVFGERLHEFYGMLSYHFSSAEDLDRAEEYLIKAGKEALKASASSEALHYYREALKLYQRKHGGKVDPDKIAILEENIGLALYYKGKLVEAVNYMDKTLANYGMKPKKHWISGIVKMPMGLAHLIAGIYTPFLKWKKIPTQKDIEIAKLYFKKVNTLAVTDIKRFPIEGLIFFKWLTSFDLASLENGIMMFNLASPFFAHSGISFRFSRKVLDFIKSKVDRNDVKSMMYYEFSVCLHNWLKGHWEKTKEFDDRLVNLSLEIGELLHTSWYMVQYGVITIEQGNFTETQRMVDKLSEINDIFDYEYAGASKYFVNTKLLMKCRRLHDALVEIDKGIDAAKKMDDVALSSNLYSYKTRVQILKGDILGAEKSLESTKNIEAEISLPYFLADLLLSQFILDVYRLEEEIKCGKKTGPSEYRKRALKSGRKALTISRKVAGNRTEVARLMGTYFWLSGKQGNALKWWSKSIAVGESLGARVEFSRTCMEVGKRLIEVKSKFIELNGITAKGYLEKARTMFEQIGLDWDLDELDRITS